MKKRHLVSYILFILGIIFLLVLGLSGGHWLNGVLVGLLFAIVGLIFYRRGK